MSHFRWTAFLATLVVLSACQDPAGVGLGLIDDQLSNPNEQLVAASLVDTVKVDVSTAGFTESGSTQPQTRVLAGRVQDALYGDASAIAYIDAKRPASIPSRFTDTTRVTFVRLELVRNYVYGDTTSVLPMQLRQVDGSWTPSGLSSDTTLGTGDLIKAFNVSASDTLVTVDLPAAWVAANGSQFAAADFLSAFEGFALSVDSTVAPMPGAVVGFNVASSQSRIRVGSRSDTLSFLFSEVFTKIRRGPAGIAPPGLLPLRAASPRGAKLSFDFDIVGALPLSRAMLRLPIDRSLSGTDGAFKRPLATRVGLYAIQGAAASLLGEVAVRNSGDPISVASTTLTNTIQDVLLGTVELTRFEARLPVSPVSLDVFPMVLHGPADQPRPRFALTVVGSAL